MLKSIYYSVKPFIPRSVQIAVRRKVVSWKKGKVGNIWPIDPNSSKVPAGWKGWPNRKKFTVILTHDVDTAKGQEKCLSLLSMEEELGFRSSFNFVPENYVVDPELREEITRRGFEVGVHGLNHDGKLYKSKEIFCERAKSINRYLLEWGCVGFRSPAMHHNLDWIHELSILYDASTFDTDPFEPQPVGVATIFPFWVVNNSIKSYFLELPYTLCQDFTLFILMRAKDIQIWKNKTEWIIENEGMVLVNVHPDYMKFGKGKPSLEEYPANYYREYLLYLRNNFNSEFWNPLPKELAVYMKEEMPPNFGSVT
jgi:hypothetical protein